LPRSFGSNCLTGPLRKGIPFLAYNLIYLVDIKEIRSLIDLMKKNGLAVFKMEREGFKITLKTDAGAAPVISGLVSAPGAFSAAPQAPAAVGAPQAAAAPEPAPSSLLEIKSPMVGTFYASPSPDASSFVEVGTKVTPETTVCILEAMKVMNEIKAEISGVVTEVCAENGKPVQFGQVLFRLK